MRKLKILELTIPKTRCLNWLMIRIRILKEWVTKEAKIISSSLKENFKFNKTSNQIWIWEEEAVNSILKTSCKHFLPSKWTLNWKERGTLVFKASYLLTMSISNQLSMVERKRVWWVKKMKILINSEISGKVELYCLGT